MANITLKREEFKDQVKEVIGYKSGLILQDKDIEKFLDDYDIKLWVGEEKIIRFRPEDYERIVNSVLFGLGYKDKLNTNINPIGMLKKYSYDKRIESVVKKILLFRIEWLNEEVKRCIESNKKNIDPTPFINESYKRYGKLGKMLAYETLYEHLEYERCSPWSSVRRVEWENTIELEDLFKSEGLETLYGTFIDQRYINYLYRNFDDIGSINWRKFEAITCEYFDRKGFHVEIGKGRNDGGIDARVWKEEDSEKSYPTIVIQCKRQKKKVENIVVKALYADMNEEKDDSGLIVTSSEISKSGKEIAVARGYKIDWCERDKLKKWIKEMRYL